MNGITISQEQLQQLLYPPQQQRPQQYYFNNQLLGPTTVRTGMATGGIAPAGSVTPSGNIVGTVAPAAGAMGGAGMGLPAGASATPQAGALAGAASGVVGAIGDTWGKIEAAKGMEKAVTSQEPLPDMPEGYVTPVLANLLAAPPSMQPRRPIYA